MAHYDTTLKQLIRSGGSVALRELTGKTVVRWLDVELPRVQNPRVDLLGEASDGELLHIELQSGNAPDMALRMSEYCLAIVRMFGKFPRQVLVYVGQEPMRMPASCAVPGPCFNGIQSTSARWIANGFSKARRSAIM